MACFAETNPCFSDWPALMQLLREAYAYMEGRIDPPSSLTFMSIEDLAQKARDEDLFLIRHDETPIACAFGHPMAEAYEIGKIAVASDHRHQGFARRLVDAAAKQATDLGAQSLQLYARVELIENHATYRALGFDVVGDFTHPGFDRPTALLFRCPV